MLQQYLEIKENNRDAVLFYRMGDFYEMFFEDAERASKILGITLTSRNNKSDAAKVPMCGIPYHASQTYIAKLVKAGHRVAICEQVEDPAQSKGIVKREVIQTISPGVLTDEQLLDDKSNNYVAAITRRSSGEMATFGLSFLDLSTGKFHIGEFQESATDHDAVVDQLARMTPAELLINTADKDVLDPLISLLQSLLPGICITEREEELFHLQSCRETLLDHFKVLNLSGFGCDKMRDGLIAAGVLLEYAGEMQQASIDHIESIAPIDMESILQIDDSSRRNLELVQTLIGGTREGSLLSVIDRTSTPMGARLLKDSLLSPLRQPEVIHKRLDCVSCLYKDTGLHRDIRQALSTIFDLERLNSRMVLGSGNGRDLLAMKHSLARLPRIKELVGQCKTEQFQEIDLDLETLDDLHQLLDTAIHEEPPVTLRDGNLIKEGYSAELDELVHLLRDGKQHIINLEASERQATGIPKLKTGYNKVFGYYLEISRAHIDKVPEHYIRKQTLVNAERFITPDLKEFENKVVSAQDRRMELEYKLFLEVRATIAAASSRLLKAAELLARIDFFASLAEVAHRNNYRRPTVDDGEEITIKEGRHPVIEQSLPGGKFVPNDVILNQSTDEVIIITGPNMAGKSTVLRQTALIVLLAQMGSFVPADEAHVGIVDKIFTRVGAMDDLRRGQSTFMVEMNETANILNNATTKSLVILDEIGRGTSTYDGLAIAWAVAEHLVGKDNRGIKTLFATHYHELTELARRQDRVQNFSIAVREWNDTIIFLHKLVRGGTNRSYGIQVAGLAGVPDSVVGRAKEILRHVESGEINGGTSAKSFHRTTKKKNTKHPNQLSLFQPPADPLRSYLQKLTIDDLTPRQALEILYEIEKIACQGT